MALGNNLVAQSVLCGVSNIVKERVVFNTCHSVAFT